MLFSVAKNTPKLRMHAKIYLYYSLYVLCFNLSLQTFVFCTKLQSNIQQGRAIAQGVSRLLPTAAARVRSQVRSYGICGGQIGTGAGLHRVLRFPLQILILPTAPQSSLSPSSIIIIKQWPT
jgi:hypothetical protein